jgi:hypothetical protein
MVWVDRLRCIKERELKDGGNAREVGVKSKKGGGPGWETVSVSGQLGCVLGKFQ